MPRRADRCPYYDDAWDDHGSFRGNRATVVNEITSNWGGASNSMRRPGNILIELMGDLANVEPTS